MHIHTFTFELAWLFWIISTRGFILHIRKLFTTPSRWNGYISEKIILLRNFESPWIFIIKSSHIDFLYTQSSSSNVWCICNLYAVGAQIFLDWSVWQVWCFNTSFDRRRRVFRKICYDFLWFSVSNELRSHFSLSNTLPVSLNFE